MKLSPQGTAGASGELFPPWPNYIVQSQCGKCLGIVRKLLAFGTGQLVAVGYMDRENWGHRPGRDAQFYYMLLSQ